MATYYVATNGSDGAAGSLAAPWRTIQRGVNALSGGDTLLIRGGTYNEAVSVPASASGTSGAHTTIKAYTGETVVIDGQYNLPSGGLYGPISAALQAGTVVKSGDNYRYVPTGDIVYKATSGPLVTIGANWVDFEDIKITRSLGRSLSIYSATGHHDNVTVKNCELSYSRAWGVTAYGTDDTLDGCNIHHYEMFAQFSRPAYSKSVGGVGLNWGSAVAQAPSLNLTVKNCMVHEGWGEGILLQTGTTVEDCKVWNCYSAHVYIEKADGCTVRRNLIWHNGTSFLRNGNPINGINITNEPQPTPGGGGGYGARVYNNIVVGCGKSLVMFANTTAYEDVQIYNNTFVEPFMLTSKTPYLIQIGAAPMTDVDIYNNIFYTSGGAAAANSSTGEGAQFAYNCWYGITPAAALRGTGDVYSNPQMIAPQASIINGAIAGNYQILEDSPCVNAGTTSPTAATDDYFGNARSTVDIGAHEYGGSISTYLYPDFTIANASGESPLTVTLTDASTSNETITARYWYYRLSGDTAWSIFETGNETSVVLQIAGAGTYDVRLRCVTATQDASEIKIAVITATAPGIDPGDPGDTGSSGATGIVGMASVAANTTAGTQLITLNNSNITPTFALITVSAAVAGSTASDAILSIGMTDGTNTRSVGVLALDGVATTETVRNSRDDDLIIITAIDGRRDARATLSAFGQGYVTINWVVAPDVGYTVNVWAIEADDAYVGDETVAASMTATDPNFESDAIFWLTGAGAFPSWGTDAPVMVGITTADTSGAVSLWWEHGSAAGDLNGYVFDGSVGLVNASGATRYSFEPAITATGWTGTLTGSALGAIAYGCIRLASNSVYCDVVDSATSTGGASNTTPAFPAGAGVAIFTNMASSGSGITDGTAGSLSVGIWAGTTQGAVGITNESAADPTVAKSHASGTRFAHVVDDDGSTTALQAYIAANDNGYDLTWEAVQGTARKGIVLVVEDTAVDAGTLAMAAVITHGSAYANTSTGNQTITLQDAITPTFAIVTLVGASSGSNPAANALVSIGMTDGTNTRSVVWSAEDNVGTTNAGRVSRNDNLIVVNNYSTTRLAYADFVSFGEGEITINWAVAPAAGYIINVLAFNADDTYIGDETVAADMSVSAPGFESDVIFWLTGFGGFSSSGNDAVFGLGITTADTTGSIGIFMDDGAATGENNAKLFDGAFGMANASANTRFSFVPAITSTGWTSGTLTGTAFGAVAYGCIRLADYSVWCDVVDSATSTGAATNTAPAFRAGGGMAIITALTAADTGADDATAGTLGIGMWAGDSQAAVGFTNEDAADPTNTASSYDSDSFIKLLDDDGSTTYLDAVVSPADEGYSLNWATAQGSSCKMILLMVEAATEAIPPIADWYLPGMAAGLIAGFP